MKKLVLTSVCALAMAGAAFAQGTVNMSVFSAAAFTMQTNAVTFSPLFGGGASGIAGATIGASASTALGFYGELLYTNSSTAVAGPGSLVALTAWSDTGLLATNVVSSTGKMVGSPAKSNATVPWDNGTIKADLFVVWSSNLGNNWTTVLSLLNNWGTQGSGVVGQAFFGMTSTGLLNPATSAANPGATIFATSGGSINSTLTQLYILPVPEPRTMALAALGGASLLLFRRRNK